MTWDGRAENLEAARRAVWSEDSTDWDERASACLDLVVPSLGLRPGDRVLDLGCGIGRLAIPLARRFPSCKIIGLDTSEKMLEWARELSKGLPNVEWVSGSDVPRVDAAFSVVTFQHLDPATVGDYLHQLGRKLRAGGIFRFQFVVGEHHLGDDHRYPETEILLSCENAGLTVLKAERGLLYPEWTWFTSWRRP